MTLNKDLFGAFIPDKPTETPVEVRPRTHIRVYHTSESETPPHLAEHPIASVLRNIHENDPNTHTNNHPDTFHVGTPAAAATRYGKYTHIYDIPKTHLNEVIFRDADNYQGVEGVNNISKVGLWENTPAYPRDAIKQQKAVGYRNAFESEGSVSYMVPKSIINDKGVKYSGVMRSSELDRIVAREK